MLVLCQLTNTIESLKIGLLDIDSHNFPNLALMKLSAYHKAKGDSVEWYIPFGDRYDIVYCSKVFSFTPDYLFCINADKVIKGGTGYAIRLVNGREVYDKTKDISLPSEVEHIYPDYTLYPNNNDTAYGFLTRGCPRGCDFCIVAGKEGQRSYKVADLREFWGGQKKIVLCDPNILACPDWRDLFRQLIESKAEIDFNQGLDIRLMTEEKAQMIAQTKIKEIHFAWDRYEDKDKVLPKLELFASITNAKPHSHNAIVYTIVNFSTTIEQDLERIYTLRGLGYWPYVMIYNKGSAARIYHDMARWVNNRFIFAKCERFEDYKKAGG